MSDVNPFAVEFTVKYKGELTPVQKSIVRRLDKSLQKVLDEFYMNLERYSLENTDSKNITSIVSGAYIGLPVAPVS